MCPGTAQIMIEVACCMNLTEQRASTYANAQRCVMISQMKGAKTSEAKVGRAVGSCHKVNLAKSPDNTSGDTVIPKS